MRIVCNDSFLAHQLYRNRNQFWNPLTTDNCELIVFMINVKFNYFILLCDYLNPVIVENFVLIRPRIQYVFEVGLHWQILGNKEYTAFHLKAATHQATSRCNNSPRVTRLIFVVIIVAAISCTNSNQFAFVQLIAARNQRKQRCRTVRTLPSTGVYVRVTLYKFIVLGRVVRKPVNVNPGFNVN